MAHAHAEEGLRLSGGRLSSTSYKLLAVDLDGTLLDHAGQPHEADRRALISLREAGVVVSILTGRLYAGTRAAAQAIGMRGPLGCADGSHLVEHDSGTTLLHHALDGARSAYLRAAFADTKASVFAFGDDTVVVDGRGEPFVPYIQTWSDDVRRCEHVLDHDWFVAGGATVIVAIGSETEMHHVRARVDAECDDRSVSRLQMTTFALKRFGNLHGLLARAETASKGTALGWLAEHHGLSLGDCVVAGDWHNDVSMFEVAGRSFAMGQAPADVKAKASDVLQETSEQGGGIARIARDVFGVDVSGA